MDEWIIYGLLAAVIVSIVDLCRKYTVNTINPYVTVLIPLCVAGTLSFCLLMGTSLYKGSKQDITKLRPNQYCLLVLIGLLIPVGHYLITKCLQTVDNPGYAKSIVSLNILISMIVSLYIFKSASVNHYTILGALLVIGGSYLTMVKH
jgi:uncharacterized membrane protein